MDKTLQEFSRVITSKVHYVKSVQIRSFFLVHIFLHLDQKKPRIWTLFTSEVILDISHKKHCVKVVPRVAKRLKTKEY